MKPYSKPMISIDTGMAEGIYAASGSNLVSFSRYDGDWGTSGIAVFSLNLNTLNRSQLTVILSFNMDINSGWGSGANTQVSGKDLTLYWYSAPESAEISIKVENNDVKKLECIGCSYTN